MKVLGVSGSPTKNSNTDVLVKAVLDATGAETEFIKLSEINVGPCIACMKCVHTNVCVVNDDFRWLSEKVIEADAIVIGSPTYYGAASAFMKAFIERLYSKRHLKLLLSGKVAVTLAVGVAAEQMVAQWMGDALGAGGMEVVGTMTAKGTPCCFVCGSGETCAFAIWNVYSKELSGMEMKSNAPSEQCDICFSEVSNVLEKQISLMRSLQIYHKEEESKQHIPEIAEEAIVRDVLEPLSNKQRFRILKAVSMETKTFTALSELTKLRGGNLLFHLQKLLDNGLIIQRHERGDYMITEKGYTIFKGVNDIYSRLKS